MQPTWRDAFPLIGLSAPRKDDCRRARNRLPSARGPEPRRAGPLMISDYLHYGSVSGPDLRRQTRSVTWAPASISICESIPIALTNAFEHLRRGGHLQRSSRVHRKNSLRPVLTSSAFALCFNWFCDFCLRSRWHRSLGDAFKGPKLCKAQPVEAATRSKTPLA